MLVKELIAKLQNCPQNAPVCWDSHDFSYYYGSSVEIEPATKEEIIESLEDIAVADEMPDDLTCVVMLS